MENFRYSTTQKGDVLLVKVGGTIDLSTAPRLSEKLDDEIKKGSKKIVLNLANVDYLASAGIGTIISARNNALKIGVEMRLSGMSEKITKIFKLLGFLNLFKSYPTDDEAADSF